MSGRWFTVATLSVCVVLVLFALWRRSLDTSQIRAFWGPTGAELIQHAPKVALQGETTAAETTRAESAAARSDPPSLANPEGWRDISAAPGLVHLRATLVDDRYFQWPARAATGEEIAASGDAFRVVRFSDSGNFVDVAIDLQQGTVVHLGDRRAVDVIPSSRDAIAAYLRLLVEDPPQGASLPGNP